MRLEYEFTLRDALWRLDFMAITVDESIELQRATGMPWVKICAGLDIRDALSVKAFFWLARRKNGEDLPFDASEMNFTWTEFQIRKATDTDTSTVDGDTGKAPRSTAPAKARTPTGRTSKTPSSTTRRSSSRSGTSTPATSDG